MFFIFYLKKIQALLLVYYRYTVIFHCYLIQDKKQKKPSPEVMFTGCLTVWMRPVSYLWVPVVRWVLAALYPDLLQRLWVPFDLLKKIKDATHKAAQLCFQTFFSFWWNTDTVSKNHGKNTILNDFKLFNLH